jgi:hypothetical protein
MQPHIFNDWSSSKIEAQRFSKNKVSPPSCESPLKIQYILHSQWQFRYNCQQRTRICQRPLFTKYSCRQWRYEQIWKLFPTAQELLKPRMLFFSRQQLNECSAMLATAQWMLCDIGNGEWTLCDIGNCMMMSANTPSFPIPKAQCISWPTAVRDGEESLKVTKCEIFDCSYLHDFYIKKSLWEGD